MMAFGGGVRQARSLYIRRAQLCTQGAKPVLQLRSPSLGQGMAAGALSIVMIVGAWPWLERWREILP
jgi:MSHA biogenesis protein MshM